MDARAFGPAAYLGENPDFFLPARSILGIVLQRRSARLLPRSPRQDPRGRLARPPRDDLLPRPRWPPPKTNLAQSAATYASSARFAVEEQTSTAHHHFSLALNKPITVHARRPPAKFSLLVKMYKIVRPYMLLLMAAAIMTPPLPGIRGGADQRRRLRNIFLYADAGYGLRSALMDAPTCVEIKILRRVCAESSCRPPRHRCDACSMAFARFCNAVPDRARWARSS